VLYRVADQYFILTAAHNLREIVKLNIPLYVGLGDSSLPTPIVNDTVYLTTEVDEGRDIAAIRLGSECTELLSKAKTFLSHSQIDLSDDGKGQYIVFGYPMAWTSGSENHITTGGLPFLTLMYTGVYSQITFFDPNIHIALSYSTKPIEVSSNRSSELPPPEGISGCGIWRVMDQIEGQFSVVQPRLVALQHRWVMSESQEYLQGTWIRYALKRIIDDDPALEHSMRLVYPRSASSLV